MEQHIKPQALFSQITDENIKKGAKILKEGGLVAFPTETVYGLGANVFLPEAVARIFEVKGRPRFDPLIVHISRHGMVSRLFREIPPLAEMLMEKFWPGPLTLVLSFWTSESYSSRGSGS